MVRINLCCKELRENQVGKERCIVCIHVLKVTVITI